MAIVAGIRIRDDQSTLAWSIAAIMAGARSFLDMGGIVGGLAANCWRRPRPNVGQPRSGCAKTWPAASVTHVSVWLYVWKPEAT